MGIKFAMPFGAVVAVEVGGLTLLGGDRRRTVSRLQLFVDRPRSRGRTQRHQAMIFGASSIIGGLCDNFAVQVRRVAERMITGV